MMLDRQEFFAMMTEAVALAGRPDRFGDLLPAGRAKTRILEAHAPEPSPEGVAYLVEEFARRVGVRAERVGDELWRLSSQSTVVGFLDTINPRFWQFHSTSSADEHARIVRSVVGADPRFDTAWLPKSMLRALDGEHLWFKSAFDSEDLLGADVSARRWRARFEGAEPEGLLDLLRNSGYEQAAALTGLGSRVHESRVGSAVVVADYTWCVRHGSRRLLGCCKCHLEHGFPIREMGGGARGSTPTLIRAPAGQRSDACWRRRDDHVRPRGGGPRSARGGLVRRQGAVSTLGCP